MRAIVFFINCFFCYFFKIICLHIQTLNGFSFFYFKLIACLVLLICCESAKASIVLNNVTSLPSKCINSGSIIVQATSPTAIVYAIISGPDTRSSQSGNQFGSLPAGSYQVLLTNFSNDTLIVNVTVSGNYQFPDFVTNFTNPICVGTATGSITGTPIQNLGLEPFSWQLTNLSTGVITTQSDSTFTNLPSGSYSLRQIDSCQNFATRSVTLFDTNSDFYFSSFTNLINDCDSSTMRFQLTALSGYIAGPLTITVVANGVTTVDTLMYNYTPSNVFYDFLYRVGNLTYGQSGSVTITNTCGYSQSISFVVPEYSGIQYGFNFTNQNCAINYIANFGLPFFLNGNSSVSTFFSAPVRIIITDNVSGQVIQNSLQTDPSGSLLQVTSIGLIPGRTYTVQLTDNCGSVFNTQITTPALQPRNVTKIISVAHCLDSTASAYIAYDNTFLSNPYMNIISGPSSIGSTKAKYAYSDTIIYPQLFPYNAFGSGGNGSYIHGFFLNNLGEGTYRYTVFDSCGNTFNDSIVIRKQDLGDDYYQLSYLKDCPGENKLIVNLSSGGNFNPNQQLGSVRVTDVSNGNIVSFKTFDYIFQPDSIYRDTIINLNASFYEVAISYSTTQGHFVNENIVCQTIIDTVYIPPYELPKIDFDLQVKCNGAINVQFFPDTNKGIPPYNYQIISGPQTTSIQSSPFFSFTLPGNYNARISDKCGFARTFSFTVDTSSFQQIIKVGSSCLGGSTILFAESSSYVTYQWVKPNGNTFISDTLLINPVTASDYGTYQITQFVNVNNCRDTFFTTYQLFDFNLVSITEDICRGDSFLFAGNNYTQQGIYYDTIATSTCDSVVALNLLVKDIVFDTIFQTICNGQTVVVGTKIYSTTGMYLDTFATTACDSIRFLNLQVVAAKRDTVSQTICQGQSIIVGNKIYNTSGEYVDTFAIAGCDSIRLLNLNVSPAIRDTVALSICQGGGFIVGNNIYNQAGAYLDTFSIAGCDSIRLLNLTVNAVEIDTFSLSICQGSSITIGLKTYATAGSYLDTFFVAGCDSIRLLNLSIIPAPVDTITQTICFGQSIIVGQNNYNTSGQYIDTFSIGGCDSIRVLNLEVLPLKSDTLLAAFCEGSNITIGGNTYVEAGLYTDTLNAGNCDSLVIYNTSTYPLPNIEIVAEKNIAEQGESIALNITTSGQSYNYLWTSNGNLSNATIQNPVVIVNEPTWVIAQATDSNNCIGTDSVLIELADCKGYIYVPNAFTPNNDGQNDQFFIINKCIKLYWLKIFNRWGEKIWQTSNINEGWDGTYLTVKQKPGVYVYYLQYSVIIDDAEEIKEMKGSVVLIE